MNNQKDITPATITGMSFTSQMQGYEAILKEESELQGKITEKINALKTLLNDANRSYSESYKKTDLVIYKEKENDNFDLLAQEFGEEIQRVLGSSKKTLKVFKTMIGQEAYEVLKEIVERYENGDENVKDEVATKKLIDAYFPLVKELTELANKRATLSKKKENANEYVNYVRNLAEIARVTQPQKSEE